MPTPTESLEKSTVVTAPADRSVPTEEIRGIGHLGERLMIPFIVVGYHLAITIIRITARRAG